MTTAAEQLDHTPLHKGKYIGKTPSQVAERDPAYLVWAWENWTPKPCSELLFKECRKDAAEETRQRRVARDQDYD
jgi:hypothetical protein